METMLIIKKFKDVLFNKHNDQVLNKGFRYIDGYMKSYEQNKKGLSYAYHKRIVCEDGINTKPLRCNRQSAAAVGARFWSRQELVWQRRTSTHSEHRKAGAVDSDQLRTTSTGSQPGEARAIGGKRRNKQDMAR